jgi:hypothetical protein
MSNGRTVSTDALETLGTIIDASQKRDAIHLAVLPVTAGENLTPGEEITITDGVAIGAEVHSLAIVDPFLAKGPRKGQMFWAILRPRLVTSLRHVWSHPAFPDEGAGVGAPAATTDVKDASEKWLRNYAAELDVGFLELVESAEQYLRDGDYMVRGDTLESISTPDEFWVHFGVYRGTPVPENERGNFFGCSC